MSSVIIPMILVWISVSIYVSDLPPPLPTVPPRFVSKVRAGPFVEGEDAQVTCTIEGTPYPQIRWACQLVPGSELSWHSCWPLSSRIGVWPGWTMRLVLGMWLDPEKDTRVATPYGCWGFQVVQGRGSTEPRQQVWDAE